MDASITIVITASFVMVLATTESPLEIFTGVLAVMYVVRDMPMAEIKDQIVAATDP